MPSDRIHDCSPRLLARCGHRCDYYQWSTSSPALHYSRLIQPWKHRHSLSILITSYSLQTQFQLITALWTLLLTTESHDPLWHLRSGQQPVLVPEAYIGPACIDHRPERIIAWNLIQEYAQVRSMRIVISGLMGVLGRPSVSWCLNTWISNGNGKASTTKCHKNIDTASKAGTAARRM